MDDDVPIEVSFDAIDEFSDISTSNGIFLEFMLNVISQMSYFLEPALQKCDVFQKIIIEFCLLFLLSNGGEILAKGIEIVLFVVTEGMESFGLFLECSAPSWGVDKASSEIE